MRKTKKPKDPVLKMDGFNLIVHGDQASAEWIAKRFGFASGYSFQRALERAILSGRALVDASGTVFAFREALDHGGADGYSKKEKDLFVANLKMALRVRKSIADSFGKVAPLSVIAA